MHISSSSAAGAEEVQGLLLARLQVEEEGGVGVWHTQFTC